MIPISLTAVEYLCINMRGIDRREIFGLRGHDNPHLLAREVVIASSYGRAAIAEHKGKPAGIIGACPMWPGVWTVFSFGTDDWPKCAMALSRYGKRVLAPFLLNAGVHRLQCESRIDHVDAHKWLSVMGAKPEGLLRGYGRDGSDYVMFSWRRGDVLLKPQDS